MLSISLGCALVAFLGFSSQFNTAFATPSATAAYAAASTGVMTSEGCYSSSGELTNQGSYEYQSSLYCQNKCLALDKPVMGLQDSAYCWCGDSLPATDTKVSSSECDTPCFGYDGEECGGATTWTIKLTGYANEVAIDGSSGSSSAVYSSSSTSSASTASVSTSTSASSISTYTSSVATSASVEDATSSSTIATPSSTSAPSSTIQATIVQVQTVTVGGSVKTVEATTVIASNVAASTDSTTSDSHTSGSSSNKAGIAAGVVVGIIALTAIVGGVVFYLKRRSKKAKESTHRRNNSLDAFVGTVGRNQALAGGVRASTMNDSRLDPRIMVERRQSAGSFFADNVDYSRRILKVANPDDS